LFLLFIFSRFNLIKIQETRHKLVGRVSEIFVRSDLFTFLGNIHGNPNKQIFGQILSIQKIHQKGFIVWISIPYFFMGKLEIQTKMNYEYSK
jgi:hypothetical protein